MDPNLDPSAQLERARVLQELSRLDGRRDRTHELHGHLTGLGKPFTRVMRLEQRAAALEQRLEALEQRLAALEGRPDPEPPEEPVEEANG